jgi:hypothetical protein
MPAPLTFSQSWRGWFGRTLAGTACGTMVCIVHFFLPVFGHWFWHLSANDKALLTDESPPFTNSAKLFDANRTFARRGRRNK